ncbi:MAG: DUF721 domain-containing protein [Endomicrobiales bacterium]|nr:DUF721 domain-containing protein [Endomicrobiales bacterium]
MNKLKNITNPKEGIKSFGNRFSTTNEIVEKLKEKLGLDEKIFTIYRIWEKELGALAKDASLYGIQNGCLIIEVASSSHLQEISLQKKRIINRINQYFGNKKVLKGIKIKMKNNET